MPFTRQKGMIIMGFFPLNAKKGKSAGRYAKGRCLITITDGSESDKAENKIFLSCTSWRNGIALLDQAMIRLDETASGLET